MNRSFDFVSCLPGLVIAKDMQSTYLNISLDFANLLGWKHSHQAEGKTDYEIPCHAADFANEFIKMDQKTIDSKEKMLALDIQNYTSGWKLVLVERNPIKNDSNEVEGLFNQCIEVSNANIFKPYLVLHQFDNKLFGKTLKPISYILSDLYNPLPLTQKQENYLFFLIRGKSISEIAKILQVSERTAECHIEAIKNKLNCYNVAEIVEKALDNGFLHYIPSNLQDAGLENVIKLI